MFCISIVLLTQCGREKQPKAKAEVKKMDSIISTLSFQPAEVLDRRKKIVLVSGDEEYRSEEALPQLAKILSGKHGFECKVLFAQDPAMPGVIDPNYVANIPGLESLEEADLVILFTRFRALPVDQMVHIENYLNNGKPILGIRTATHAFMYEDSSHQYYPWGNYFSDDSSPWNEGFGKLVLGENWNTHHGYHKHQSTRGVILESALNHPLVQGLSTLDIWGPTDVYGVDLPSDATPLVWGQVIDRAGEYDESDPFFGMKPSDSLLATGNPAEEPNYNPNDPLMPIAWTKPYKLPEGRQGLSFTSTIGSSTDLKSEGVRRLLVNAAYFLLNIEIPASLDVDLVGKYEPSAYSFQSEEYWDEKRIKVSDFY